MCNLVNKTFVNSLWQATAERPVVEVVENHCFMVNEAGQNKSSRESRNVSVGDFHIEEIDYSSVKVMADGFCQLYGIWLMLQGNRGDIYLLSGSPDEVELQSGSANRTLSFKTDDFEFQINENSIGSCRLEVQLELASGSEVKLVLGGFIYKDFYKSEEQHGLSHVKESSNNTSKQVFSSTDLEKIVRFSRLLIDQFAKLVTDNQLLNDRIFQVEKALAQQEQSEGHYKALFNNNHSVMLIISPDDGAIRDANGAACKFYGYSRKQLIAMNIRQINTSPPERIAAEMRKAKAGLENKFHFLHRLADGSEREVEVYSGKITIENEDLLYSIIHDITERRKAEELLQLKTEELDRYFSNSLDLLCIADTNGVFLRLNPEWEKVIGYKIEELEGRKFLDFVHPEDVPATMQVMSSLIDEIEILSFENRYICKDGSYRWIEWRSKPLDNKIYAVARDIHHRKMAEDRIRENEQFLKTVISAVTQPFAVIDVNDYSVVMANEAYGRTDAGLRKCYEVSHGFSAPCSGCDDPCPMEMVKSTAKPHTLEHLHLGPDGKPRNIEIHAYPVFDKKGKVVQIIEYGIDITERRKTEVALRESEEQHRLLFETAQEGILVIQDGKFVYFNPKAVEITGYSADKLLNMNFLHSVYEDDKIKIAENYHKRLSGKAVDNHYEFRILNADGEVRWIELSAARFEWKSNPATLNLISDITEKKKAEVALRESEDQFHRIIENLPFSLSIITFDGTVLYANQRAVGMFETSREELLGKKLVHLAWVNASDRGIWLKKIREEGLVSDFEIHARTSSGKELWLLGSGLVIKYQGQDCILSVHHDITDRKQADEKLRESLKNLSESEEKYRSLVDTASEVIVVIQDGLIKFVNKIVETVTGYTAEELFMQPFAKSIHPDDAGAAIQRSILHEQGQEVPHRYEFRILNKSGDVVWLLNNSVIIEWEGKPAILNLLTDITLIKNTSEALRVSEEKFREMADMLPQVVFEVNLNLEITYVNKRLYSLMHIPEDVNVTGINSLGFYVEEDAERVKRNAKLRLKGETAADNQYTIKRFDGTTFQALIFVNAFYQNGVASGFRGILVDISDRIESENKLKETNAYLENLINYANAPIIVWDNDYKITRFNKAFEHLTGHLEQEVLGRKLSILFPETQRSQTEQLLDKTKAGGRLESVEIDIQHANGSVRTVLWNSAPVFAADNKMISTIAQGQDITGRKQAEAELQKSEEKYRLLTENSSDVIWVLNLNKGKFSYISPAIRHLRGLSVQEALEEKLEDSMSPESAEYVRNKIGQNLKSFLENQENIHNEVDEVMQPHKNGNMIWVEVSTRFRMNKDGEVEIVGASRNIDERKRFEQEQNAFFRAATELANAVARLRVEAIDEGINECLGILGRYLDADRAYIFSADFEKSTWSNTHEWCSAIATSQYDNLQDFPFESFPGLMEVFIQGNPLIVPELEVLKGSPSEEAIEMLDAQDIKALIMYPMWVDGKMLGAVGFDDIKGSRKFRESELALLKLAADYFSATLARHEQYKLTLNANLELTKSIKHATELAIKADAANQAKSEFLTNISHEIRTPMNSILGFSEIMLNTTQDGKQKNYLKTILDSGRSLLSLINDILDLSKIEAGRMDIVAEPTDLRGVIHEISQLFQYRAREKNISLETIVNEDVPVSVMLDDIRLRQILLNLAGNAIKFTENGSVIIGVQLLNNYTDKVDLEIWVSDTGIGIPAEDQQKIFEAFSQQSGQDSRKYGGTGLGLAISKRLCELMGGEIILDSRQGKGSKFSVVFKNISAGSGIESKKLDYYWDEPEVEFFGSKILIVDDALYNRALIVSYLEGFRFQLFEASGGDEALKIARLQKPELVLMDIRLPGISGFEIAKQMKDDKELQSSKIIAVSASSLRHETVETGNVFDGYIRKPVQKNALLRELIRILPHKLSQKQAVLSAASNSDVETTTGIPEPYKTELREKYSSKISELSESMIVEEISAISIELGSYASENLISELSAKSKKLDQYMADFDFDKIHETLLQILKMLKD